MKYLIAFVAVFMVSTGAQAKSLYKYKSENRTAIVTCQVQDRSAFMSGLDTGNEVRSIDVEDGIVTIDYVDMVHGERPIYGQVVTSIVNCIFWFMSDK